LTFIDDILVKIRVNMAVEDVIIIGAGPAGWLLPSS
jgi:ribulose 1,5-bisphosphate synthetase/thiazole synthase